MKVYCPCGRRCTGFSGTARKCQRVGTSGTMPPEFISHRASRQEGTASKILSGLFDVATPYLASQTGGKVTYHVWQCPVCRCKVLTQSVKTGNGSNESKAAEISDC